MTNNHTDIELQKDVLEELKWDARITTRPRLASPLTIAS